MLRLVLPIAMLWALPAVADDYRTWQSPTGNIHCLLYAAPDRAFARCDLIELTPSHDRPPPDCNLDWGNSFAVEDRGAGYLACVGDTVVDRNSQVLSYGLAISLGGITCVSSKSGMTCTNADGHGFSVARAEQRLY